MWETRTSSCGRRSRRGYTLVELVVSLGVMSVLAVAVSSAVVVSMRSVEDFDSHSSRIRTAATVSHQVMAELSCTLGVPERADEAVTLAVPDRDGDGASEQIRYSWSGTPGAALMRQYNTEAPVAILENVHWFQLAYAMTAIVMPPRGGDLLLAAHDSKADLSNFKIKSQDWVSQSFRASLPSGGTAFKVKRVSLYGEQVGDPGGELTLELRLAQADGRPTSTIYCETSILESDLTSSKEWQSFELTCSTYFSPSAMLCLLIKGNTSDVCELRYHSKNVNEEGYFFGTTDDGGASWSIKSSQALLFEIWGAVSGVSEDAESAQTVLAYVQWDLQAGGGSENRVHAGAQMMNLPE